jgi:type IV secretion system protein VirB4
MLRDPSDDLAMLPDWARKERPMASMLPYVSLVDDRTIRTRGNALFQCIRLDGVNSMTSDDAHLEKIRALFAAIIAQIEPEYSFYVHKVSRAIETTLPPMPDGGFAQALDTRWQAAMAKAGLRDKTLTLTVLKRPPAGARLRLKRSDSIAQLKDQTAKQLRKLSEVVGFLLSSFAEMNPRLLGAESGELLGFLGALNVGQERPLFAKSRFGIIAEDVANTRVTFQGRSFTLDDGAAGKRFGTSFAIKTYPARTSCTMFDELNLPIDMVVILNGHKQKDIDHLLPWNFKS